MVTTIEEALAAVSTLPSIYLMHQLLYPQKSCILYGTRAAEMNISAFHLSKPESKAAVVFPAQCLAFSLERAAVSFRFIEC